MSAIPTNTTESQQHKIELVCVDGVRLTASLICPVHSARASVLILPGAGVSQSFYHPFAHYLARQGFKVLTLDYRGIGHSFIDKLPTEQASLGIWARQDAVAGFRYLQALDGQAPLIFGHSFGGQALCLVDELNQTRGAVMVASQSGYWRHWRGAEKLKLWLFWHLYLPFLSRLGAYTPATPLFDGVLPAGVAREWAKWGRHPRYLCGYDLQVTQRLSSARTRVVAYAFSDDDFAPPAAAQALWKWFPEHRLRGNILTPEQLAVRRIGHFSAFKPAFEANLWQRWKTDLEQLLN